MVYSFFSAFTKRLAEHVKYASASNMENTLTQPHRNSNTHRTKNNTTNVVIQQHSRKLLMMDILMSETCWAHKKWNKIASDIKLVFYSSTITMIHGPINIRFTYIPIYTCGTTPLQPFAFNTCDYHQRTNVSFPIRRYCSSAHQHVFYEVPKNSLRKNGEWSYNQNQQYRAICFFHLQKETLFISTTY